MSQLSKSRRLGRILHVERWRRVHRVPEAAAVADRRTDKLPRQGGPVTRLSLPVGHQFAADGLVRGDSLAGQRTLTGRAGDRTVRT